MGHKSISDLFFFYDAEWSAQDLLKQSLERRADRFAAVEEIAILRLIMAGDDSPLRGYALFDYNSRVVAGKREDLRSEEQVNDYFDYLHQTVRPLEGDVEVAAKVLYMRANSKQNL